MIAAGSGYDLSLKAIRQGFMNGLVTNDDFEKALRAHKAANDEVKSEQRKAAAAVLPSMAMTACHHAPPSILVVLRRLQAMGRSVKHWMIVVGTACFLKGQISTSLQRFVPPIAIDRSLSNVALIRKLGLILR